MRVAAVQMCSRADRDQNLATAAALIARAVADGASLVVLPEMFNLLGSGAVLRAGAEPLDGVTATWAAAQAAEHAITLVAGTFVEATDGDRNRNTCCVFAPDGSRLAVYRKIHLFDVEVPGAEYRESEVIAPGEEIVVARVPAPDPPATAAGADRDSIGLGLSVCYDVRFPELYRLVTLAGADLVTVPAAFTATTGPPHWEVLLRARAIEDHLFVVAAGQHGSSNDRLHWHGHSMIIDPWGTILGQLPTGDGVVVADLDLADQDRIRGVLPSVANRRPATYAWPT